jgi:hypothetical protein
VLGRAGGELCGQRVCDAGDVRRDAKSTQRLARGADAAALVDRDGFNREQGAGQLLPSGCGEGSQLPSLFVSVIQPRRVFACSF